MPRCAVTTGTSPPTARLRRSARRRAHAPRPGTRALDVLAHAAGDVDRRAGDVARAVAEQEGDEPRDLVGRPEAAERDLLLREPVEELLGREIGRAPPADVLPLRRDDEADVDP